MKITEARNKVKKIKELISEFSMLDSLIRTMNKSQVKKLKVDQKFLENVKNRQNNILKIFVNLLK